MQVFVKIVRVLEMKKAFLQRMKKALVNLNIFSVN